MITESTLDRERIDFEAIENLLHSAIHQLGCVILEKALNALTSQHVNASAICQHGHRARDLGSRPKKILTVLGPVTIWREYFYDAVCGKGWCPSDRILDVADTMFSPGVRNMMAYVGSKAPFAEGAEDLRRLASLSIPAKSIERFCEIIGKQVEEYRWHQEANSDCRILGQEKKNDLVFYLGYDGTGFPVLKRETVGRKGKGENEEAKTREMKVGCVFTQTRRNDEGYPVRDESSTSYFGACEKADVFSHRVLHEADVRGLSKAHRVCVLGDGAPWIWNIADERFPTATQIVDLYHAREHYNAVARMVFPEKSKRLLEWTEKRKKELDKGDIYAVVRALSRLQPKAKKAKDARDKCIGYFQNNAHRMRYEYFRSLGLFVGSGVIEAGCKTLVGQRLKLSGMHWKIQSADSIVAIRCLFLSGQWDDFWEYRAAA